MVTRDDLGSGERRWQRTQGRVLVRALGGTRGLRRLEDSRVVC